MFDPPDPPDGLWTAEDVCAIYARLLMMGWLDPECATDRMMAMYAAKLGHYTRLARREREQRTEQALRTRHVHPLMRKLVNDACDVYDVPSPWESER